MPGNHDAARDHRALDLAAEPLAGCVLLPRRPVLLADAIALVGNGLRSTDGGLTCAATSLADVTAVTAQLLVWARHYPLISQAEVLLAAGLRYPGDLTNLTAARRAAERQAGPILVLHGHLHTAVTVRDGRILQLGFPALVEWPHAWTDVRLDVSPAQVMIRTALRPVAATGRRAPGTACSRARSRRGSWRAEAGQTQRVNIGPMDLGLHIVEFNLPGGPPALADNLRDIAVRAEQAGFTKLSVMDHLWQISMASPRLECSRPTPRSGTWPRTPHGCS